MSSNSSFKKQKAIDIKEEQLKRSKPAVHMDLRIVL
jgi:hypothetical protein